MDLISTVFLGAVGVIALLLATFHLLFTYAVWKRHKSLAHIPGPKRSSFYYGNWTDFASEQSNTTDGTKKIFAAVMLKWCLEYGRVYVFFILNKGYVVTIEPEVVKTVMLDPKNFPKDIDQYRSLMTLFSSRFIGRGLVTEMDYEQWNQRRNIYNHGFIRSNLKSWMSIFDHVGEELMTDLASLAETKNVIVLKDVVTKAALNAIVKTGYSIDWEPSEFEKVNQVSMSATAGFQHIIKKPFSQLAIFSDLEFKKEVKEACVYLRKFAIETIKERREALAAGEHIPNDILSLILRMQDDTELVQEGAEVAIDDFLTFLQAGMATTANTVCLALMELGRNKHIYQRLQAEVDHVLGEKNTIEFNDLSELNYCESILKETLRMYPVAMSMRVVQKDNLYVNDYYVPKGSTILVGSYISSRHPDFYKNPTVFDPDRSLNENELSTAYVTYPFLLGPRNCIGQNFARMEAKVFLAKFAQRFDMQLESGQTFEILDDMTPVEGVKVTITFRNQ